MPDNPIYVAIDTADMAHAEALAKAVVPYVGGLKLGLEFYSANGPEGVRRLADLGRPIFLDLKLHDIPATVAGAVKALAPLGVRYLTIHASGGPAMVEAAVAAATAAAKARQAQAIRLLAVTVLTSLDGGDLERVGQPPDPAEQTLRLGRLALEAGASGLICSPLEIQSLRLTFGRVPVLMVPGIRPDGTDKGDQKRVLTPEQAMAAGATHLVIGRPITRAADPSYAAAEIASRLA